MHIQLDVSQVRSQRKRWPASSGSGNSTQMRGMSRGTSATRSAYADAPVAVARSRRRSGSPDRPAHEGAWVAYGRRTPLRRRRQPGPRRGTEGHLLTSGRRAPASVDSMSDNGARDHAHRAVDGLDVPRELRGDLRDGRTAGVRRRRGHGVDRPGHPGARGGAGAQRPSRPPGPVGARPDSPSHPTGLGHRRMGEGGPLDRDGARPRGANRGPAPAVPVAARVCGGVRRRARHPRGRDGHPAGRREHVPVAGPDSAR